MRLTHVLRRFFLAGLVLPFLWTASDAQNAIFPELSADVPGQKDVTYLDLARMVLPDLTDKGDGSYQGSHPIEMHNIAGAQYDDSPPDTTSIFSVSVLAIKAAGKDRLTMLLDLGQSADSASGYAVLALYDLSGKPKLLDATDVASDQMTSFREPDKLSLGPSDDALIAMSMHFNSSQGYVTTELIMVRDDKFDLIDSIFTFDENLCAYKRTQTIDFQTASESGPYAAIKATVTDATVPGDGACDDAPPVASSTNIPVTYHWDSAASRYRPDSDAFDKLAKENEKRF